MGLNTNFSEAYVRRVERYAQLLTKRNVVPSSVRLGFEWEIPFGPGCVDCSESDFYEIGHLEGYFEDLSYDESDCFGARRFDDSNSLDEFGRVWLEKLGYRSHIECGGLEIDSPVFTNIASAHAHFRHISALAEKSGYFTMEGNKYLSNDCGTHVHVSCNDADVELLEHIIFYMWNRTSSAVPLANISGRFSEDYGEYISQAEATQWDNPNSRFGHRDHQVTRVNFPGNATTVEFRMFSARKDRVPVAIDTAHSCYRFAREWVRSKNIRSIPFPQDAESEIPFLTDWKKWVDKQRGYPYLKQDLTFQSIM